MFFLYRKSNFNYRGIGLSRRVVLIKVFFLKFLGLLNKKKSIYRKFIWDFFYILEFKFGI